jgi:hypothetical protein
LTTLEAESGPKGRRLAQIRPKTAQRLAQSTKGCSKRAQEETGFFIDKAKKTLITLEAKSGPKGHKLGPKEPNDWPKVQKAVQKEP